VLGGTVGETGVKVGVQVGGRVGGWSGVEVAACVDLALSVRVGGGGAGLEGSGNWLHAVIAKMRMPSVTSDLG
jgi:hypothetical protein